MAMLEVVRAPERMPSQISLLKSTTMVGRDPTSDICLQWDGVSRQHVRLVADARHLNGSGIPTQFTLIDCGGANGTFLNGARVSKAVLTDGDEIAIGRGREQPVGGVISGKNVQYVFVIRTLKGAAGRGRLGALGPPGRDSAVSGPQRQPLRGQELANDQRRAREARAGKAAGEVFPPCTSMVYAPSGFEPSSKDDRAPDSELVLEFVYGCRGSAPTFK